MCEIITKQKAPGEWDITCAISGKPIEISNENGMYCEDMCGEDNDKKAGEELKDMLSSLNKMFESYGEKRKVI